MPASWVSDVPHAGKICLFYTRTKEVIDEIKHKGSCDWKAKPNPLHHPAYFSEYVPQWLEELGLGECVWLLLCVLFKPCFGTGLISHH